MTDGLPPVVGEGSGDIISLLLRESTARQVGNNRSEVQADMLPHLLAQGYRVRLYEEHATSGSDLSRRKVTLRMLQDLKQGHSRGLAALDVKRLTRDEFGVDGGTIARILQEQDAIFVTWGKTYDLRDEDDLLQFQFQCWMAGLDWRNIRNTFWSGIFKRLEKGPMFVRPPLGYMTEYTPGPIAGQMLKRPMKDAACAKLMDEIAAAFAECKTLGQVARRLHERGFERPPVTYKGRVSTAWTVQGLRYLLWEDIYTGVWQFGGPTTKKGAKRSNVWHKFGRDAAGKHKVYRYDVPEFQYWTPSKARAWREKFKTDREGPLIRERKWPHPLLASLECVACGAAMIGAGEDGYVCRHHRTSGCAQPQKLNGRVACALLRTILDDALELASDLAERAERLVAQRTPSDQALQLAEARERSRGLAKIVANMKNPNDDLVRELDDLQGEINRLQDLVANEEDEQQASDELRVALGRIRHAPVQLFDGLPSEQQTRVYAMLFKGVRIGYSGRGTGRRWWLESYEPVLGDGRIHVLHPHVARILPWAVSGRLGLPSLRVDAPEVSLPVNRVSVGSAREISAYVRSLRDLSAVLGFAA